MSKPNACARNQYLKAKQLELDELRSSISLVNPRLYQNTHSYLNRYVENRTNWFDAADYDERDIFTKTVIIKQNSICVYKEPLTKTSYRGLKRPTDKNLTRGKYNGYISRATKSRLSNILENWSGCVIERRQNKRHKFERIGAYLTFATLSLPSAQKHSDNEIKRHLLVPFIDDLKRVRKVKHYFWKAETQKNGNIHFHLIIDKFIDNKELQADWNVKCNKLGYLDRYYEKTGDINPPSTDIRKLPKGKAAIGYLIKYNTKSAVPCIKGEIFQGKKITKSGLYDWTENEIGKKIVYLCREIEGRVWGCSTLLKSVKSFSIDLSYNIEQFIEDKFKRGKLKGHIDEHFQVYFGDVPQLLKKDLSWLYWKIRRYHSNLFKVIYSDVSQALSFQEVESDPIKNWQPPPLSAVQLNLNFT
jgi:hypothetical protein